MNTLRKASSCLLIAAFTFVCTACGNPTPNKSLYTHGLEMAPILQEVATSEAHLAFYMNSIGAETLDIVAAAGAGDYSAPSAVYAISVLHASYYSMDTTGFSDALAAQIDAQALASFPQMLNGRGGSSILTASVLCVYEKVFVVSPPVENAIYIYTFEQGAPIAVTFTTGEGGAVHARASFLLHESENMYSAQAIEALFEAYGFTAIVEEITQ